MIIPDYHIHTALCKHAKGNIADFKNHAYEKKLDEICFTDHAPTPDGYDPHNRMIMEELQCYYDTISSLAYNTPPCVLVGLEADYYKGCREYLDNWLPKQPLDFVLGAVHYIDGWSFDNPDECSTWESVNITGVWKAYFMLIVELVETGLFDAIAHLDLPKKFGYRPSDKDLMEMAQPVFDIIAGSGMAIELNTSGLRKPVKEIYPSPMLLELAQERNIPICFGSDAHLPEEVGYSFKEASQLATKSGYRQALRFRNRKQHTYSLI